MLSPLIKQIEGQKPRNLEFVIELNNYLNNHIKEDRPLFATHGFCTDGGTAGALIHFARPEGIIIPLDYDLINNEIASPILSNINWEGIVDLKPFNKKTVDFWVDHHLSAVGEKVNANKIRFDKDGDSGSWQLFLSEFLGEIPEYLIELAVMTRTTDTAGYIIEPPIDKLKSLTDLDLTVTEGIEGRKQQERRIWLLDDSWGAVRSLKDHLKLYDLLAKEGFIGLRHWLNRVNELREERIKGYEIANNIEINSDVIVFSFIQDTLDKFTITRRLQSRGAKVVISLSKGVDGVKISFRRNKNLSEEENTKIQLNQLAEKLNGGGHAAASGGFSDDAENALKVIKNWCGKLKLSIKYLELN